MQYQKDLDSGVFPTTPLTSDTVRYWSDFSRVYYHPRSSIQISEYSLDSPIAPFDRHETGKELFQTLNAEHDLLDRDFRAFAEECDSLQGVNVISSVDDGWGGFASSYVEELRDEYGKLPVFVWGMEKTDRVAREKQIIRDVARAKAWGRLVELGSLSCSWARRSTPSRSSCSFRW